MKGKRPKIISIDLKNELYNQLASDGFTLFRGSLGPTVAMEAPSNGYIRQLANHTFPPNIHEYDISIFDLNQEEIIPYSYDNNQIFSKDKNYAFFVCKYPIRLFDPKPFSLKIFNDSVSEIEGRIFIYIVFACKNYAIEYETMSLTGAENTRTSEIEIYNFLPKNIISEKRSGHEVEVCNIESELSLLLNNHKFDLHYNQTFKQAKVWFQKEQILIDDKSFTPLMKNINGEIVSFIMKEENKIIYVFPDIKEKYLFLKDLLNTVLPSFHPEIFPNSTKYSWTNDPVYYLPNQQKLVDEKAFLNAKYEELIKEKEKEITSNSSNYSFLHEILIETGDKLVIALQKYLSWLGFENVEIKDEYSESIKEEDLYIELKTGLLIIETKGIGGTSTDNDCNQILKIRNRRSKERKRFDVFALYIVNHQRHLPPHKRKNPPFTEHQIEDAIYDERGLLTTWQLFNLYYNIENDFITKKEAREAMLSFGLVEFAPKHTIILGKPKEYLSKIKVAILDIKETKVKVGDRLVIKSSERYQNAEVISIQISNQDALEASDSEVGLKLDVTIEKDSLIYIKKQI